jgi:hypothetical protein
MDVSSRIEFVIACIVYIRLNKGDCERRRTGGNVCLDGLRENVNIDDI